MWPEKLRALGQDAPIIQSQHALQLLYAICTQAIWETIKFFIIISGCPFVFSAYKSARRRVRLLCHTYNKSQHYSLLKDYRQLFVRERLYISTDYDQ